eukprot:TRINITY_DN10758_c0_g1_i1.p1 TRINITY_DN10758_c0_g1~~TRINITY_DN10758_c0_g1_i1.p1  ORF type:complete len:370 (+),score=59.01 TRINITY_DN10758_c0_g1_i1:60-1112(+)
MCIRDRSTWGEYNRIFSLRLRIQLQIDQMEGLSQDISEKIRSLMEECEWRTYKCKNGFSIKFLKNVYESFYDELKALNLPKEMDVIKDVYEGGFKVWECTYDLLDFLCEENSVDFKGKVVIDLGCGHGLLGIFALMQGASFVVFQDFNKEVLKLCVELNLHANEIPLDVTRIGFISGDWSTNRESFLALKQTVAAASGVALMDTSTNMFDYVLTSEVLYNPENYGKLADVMGCFLKPSSGIGLIGSKVYYFGCGGSVEDFKVFMQTNKGEVYKVWTVKEIVDKRSYRREILGLSLLMQDCKRFACSSSLADSQFCVKENRYVGDQQFVVISNKDIILNYVAVLYLSLIHI